MMHRTRRRSSAAREVFPAPYSHQSSPERYPQPHREERDRVLSPDPIQHASALVESFGARTAIQIAQFNAQLAGATGRYWADVLDSVANAWGSGVGDFTNGMGHLTQSRPAPNEQC